MAFRGHAQKGKVDPLILPDMTDKIIEQGSRMLKQMKVVQETTLQNNVNWLRSKEAADRQMLQSLDTAFKLDEQSMALRAKHKAENYNQQARQIEAKAQDTTNFISALSGFSQAAFKYGELQKEKEVNRQKTQGFWAAMLGDVEADGIVVPGA